MTTNCLVFESEGNDVVYKITFGIPAITFYINITIKVIVLKESQH